MAYVKKLKIGDTTYDIADGRIITLVDNNSPDPDTTNKISNWVASTEAPAGNITEYKDGQLFYYKIAKAGSTTTTLNIDGLGAKTIYRSSTAKLTTHYPVGSYILLVYNSTDDCFRVVNDYATDSDSKTASSNTSSKIFLIGATTQSTSGQKTYSHDTAYVDANGRVNSRMNGGDTVAPVVTTSDAGEAVVKSISGGSGSFTPTTKYLHKSTTNVAPNAHTHTVTVSGTTGANSGTAVTAVTAVGANGTATVLTGVKASTTDTFLKDITEGSGSLIAQSENADGRIQYVESISSTGASANGTVTVLKGVKASGSDTFLKTINGGSGSLKSYDAATNGNAKTSSGRVPYLHDVSHTAASLTGTTTFVTAQGAFSAGTTPVSSASFTGSAVTSGANSGTAITAVTGVAADGTASALTGVKVSSSKSAAPGGHTHTVTVSGTTEANSGTAVKAVTGYGSFSGGELTGTKTFNTDAIKSISGTKNYGFSASTSNIMTAPTVTNGVLS